MRQIISGIFVLHRGRIPGFSNWRTRMPGGPELEGQNTSGKSEVRARLPRPHFCNTGPDYLVGQITWSRPKVGQIAWARAWSIGEGRRGEGRGEDGDGVLTRTTLVRWSCRGAWKRASRPLFFLHLTPAPRPTQVSQLHRPAPLARGVHHTHIPASRF